VSLAGFLGLVVVVLKQYALPDVIVALILPQISMALAMTMLLTEYFLDEKIGEEKTLHGEKSRHSIM